jgi:hypothetical protein
MFGSALVSLGAAIVLSVSVVVQGEYKWWEFFKFIIPEFIIIFVAVFFMFSGMFVLVGAK